MPNFMHNHIVLDIEQSADDGDLGARLRRHDLKFDLVYAPNTPLRESEWSRWTTVSAGYIRAGWQALQGMRSQDRLIFFTAGLALTAAMLSRFTSGPAPEIAVLNFIYRRRPGWLGRGFELFVKRALEHIAWIGVPSREAAAYYRECFPKAAARFQVFPTWCGFPEEPPAVSASTTAVFSGGRSMRDYGTLLEALRRLEISANIAASRTAMEGLAIPPNVNLAFDVPHQEFAQSMMQAAVVVVPLQPVYFDAGQSVVLQAMCYGKPIVATDTAGLADYIDHGRTGLLVPPDDPEALAAAIKRLLDDATFAAALGKAGREAYQTRYSRDAFVRRLASAFAENVKPQRAAT